MSLDPQTANAAIRSEINITPLVDVCLVLLIIFMVVTPLLQAGVAVDLPQTSKAPALPGEESQLTVSIQGDGSVHVRDVRVELPNLPEYLAGIHAAQPGVDVIVRGDRRLQYDRVCEVLAIISQAGFQRVGLVTEKREVAAGT